MAPLAFAAVLQKIAWRASTVEADVGERALSCETLCEVKRIIKANPLRIYLPKVGQVVEEVAIVDEDRNSFRGRHENVGLRSL